METDRIGEQLAYLKERLFEENMSLSSQEGSSHKGSQKYENLKKEFAHGFNFPSKTSNSDEETNNSEKNINEKNKVKKDCESEDNNTEMELDEESEGRRVSAFSKVNFKKLTEEEKNDRLKNLSKLIKNLRKKVKNLEHKFKSDANITVNKCISQSVGTNVNFNLDKLCKALKIVKESDSIEYEDQRNPIENLIELIAEEKLTPDSVNFKKICTQIRLFLNKERIKYVSKRGQKITFSFPEKDINISGKEYEMYSKYKDREDIIRVILGMKEETPYEEYPEQVKFDSQRHKEHKSVNQKLNKGFNLSNTSTINDLLTRELCSGGNNIQSLLMNSIYSNLLSNIKNNNNFS